MTQFAGTTDTFDLNTLKESLDPVIWELFPMDTYFQNNVDKVDVTNTQHQWVFDTLNAAANNKQIQGDDVTAATQGTTTRVSNYTQIARKVSGSNFLYRETYAVLSLIYLTITITGSLLIQWVERALKTESAVTNNPDLIRRAPRLLAATIVIIVLLIFVIFRWIVAPAPV
jgi:hypothetical protein